MMIHNCSQPSPLYACTLKDVYVQQIRSGKKTYEGRIFSGPFVRYKAGMRVRWFAGNKSNVVTEITDVQRFDTFRKMLEDIGYKKFLPGASSLETAITAYHAIPKYQERVMEHGAIALGLLVLPDIPPKSKKRKIE